MKALVTGGTGFIGSYLVKAIRGSGHECRCLVRPTSDAAHLREVGAELVVGDVTDRASLRGVAGGTDVVFHLAAAGHVTAASEEAFRAFTAINVDGARNLAEECAGAGVQRFVHFSSTAAMGLVRQPVVDETTPPQPRTPYQRSKLASEEAVLAVWRERGLPVVIVRPCMVYGPGGRGEFLKICRLLARGLFPKVGWGRNLTPAVFVSDVVAGALLVAERGRPGDVYLLAGSQSWPMADIRRVLLAELGRWRPYPYVPVWLALLAADMLERWARWRDTVPLVTRPNIESTVFDRVISIEKARRELGWEPQVDLGEGMQRTVRWFRAEGLL